MNKRILTLGVLAGIAFGVDILALFNLQVLDADKYKVLSDRNRIKVKILCPKRGEIFDRNGEKIAYNIPNYRVSISNSEPKKITCILDSLKEYVSELDLTENEVISASKKLPPHAYIPVKNFLTWKEYATLAVNNLKLNYVLVEQDFIRKYTDKAYAHVVGYIGQAENNNILKHGKSGIEKNYNDILLGEFGHQKIEVNSSMKLIRILDTVKPINGTDLHLTIDDKLQKFVFKTISEYEAASCVVLDVNSGEILACVSCPAFDQEVLSNKISDEGWKKILEDKYHPLNDRVFKSGYPPGSTFKIFMAYAALKSGVISKNEKIFCPGHMKLGTDTFHCWNRGGHGHVNLKQAITQSCDVYFFEIAKRMGIDNISRYANEFGFGKEVCPDVQFERTGLMPSREWKLLHSNKSWKTYETLITGIGQGCVLATAIQMAVATARLCTGNTNLIAKLILESKEAKKNANINKDGVAEIVKNAMYAVCNEYSGTAYNTCKTKYGIAGKTGSAQVRRIKKGEHGMSQFNLEWKDRDHGLFLGFAPFNSPKYAISVIIEHGGGGGVAAGVARKIFDKLILNGGIVNE